MSLLRGFLNRVERVAVENQVVRVAEEAIVRVGQVPCHLGHPRFVRVTRDTSDLHGASLSVMTKKAT